MANFADDFEAYGTGAGIPSGYAGRWNYAAGEWDRVSDTDVALRHVENNINRTAVTLDAVDADGNRANCEILARFKSTVGVGSLLRGGVVGRASGAAGSESGYTCAINDTELRVGKYAAGVSSQVGITTGKALGTGYYWLRFRVNGTASPVSLKARVWADGAGEPGTWDLDLSDSTSPITAAGWCGLFTFSDGTKHWRDIAVATNGDTATMSAPAAALEAGAVAVGVASAALSTGIAMAASAQAAVAATADLTTGAAFYRPSSDIVTGGWVASPGGTLASCVDEASADDNDHITSPDTSTAAVLGMSPAMPAGNQTIRLRAARTGATGQVRVRLLDAANTDVGGTAWQALTTTPTTYTLAATITATADRYRIEVQP